MTSTSERPSLWLLAIFLVSAICQGVTGASSSTLLIKDVIGTTLATMSVVDSANQEKKMTRSDMTSDLKMVTLNTESGQQMRLALARNTENVLGKVTVMTEEGEKDITDQMPQDCFFEGKVEGDESSSVQLALCEGEVMGTVVMGNESIDIQSVPTSSGGQRSESDAVAVKLVRASNQQSHDISDEEIIPRARYGNIHRQVTRHTNMVTIEILDIADRHYIRELAKDRKTSDSQVTSHIRLKWNQAQQYFNNAFNSRVLNWRITLRVTVRLWRSHPSWYKAYRADSSARLNEICGGTGNENYDQITLHTGDTTDWSSNGGTAGRAYTGGLCDKRYRCAMVVHVSYRNDAWVEIHELGHNLNLGHDWDMPECRNEPSGFMDYTGSTEARNCYKQRMDKLFKSKDADCIF